MSTRRVRLPALVESVLKGSEGDAPERPVFCRLLQPQGGDEVVLQGHGVNGYRLRSEWSCTAAGRECEQSECVCVCVTNLGSSVSAAGGRGTDSCPTEDTGVLELSLSKSTLTKRRRTSIPEGQPQVTGPRVVVVVWRLRKRLTCRGHICVTIVHFTFTKKTLFFLQTYFDWRQENLWPIMWSGVCVRCVCVIRSTRTGHWGEKETVNNKEK